MKFKYRRNRVPASVFRHPVHFLAFGLGSGAAPTAPGTFGSLAAVALWLPLARLPLGSYLLVVLLAFLLGIWLCGKTSRDLQVHDHSGIVWDEFVGYWLTMAGMPYGLGWALAGFVLFRFFDVLKPFPIAYLDRRLDGGFGIMFDDVVAALYAWLSLRFLVSLF